MGAYIADFLLKTGLLLAFYEKAFAFCAYCIQGIVWRSEVTSANNGRPRQLYILCHYTSAMHHRQYIKLNINNK